MSKSPNQVVAEQGINNCCNPDCAYNIDSEPCPFGSIDKCSEGRAWRQIEKMKDIDEKILRHNDRVVDLVNKAMGVK